MVLKLKVSMLTTMYYRLVQRSYKTNIIVEQSTLGSVISPNIVLSDGLMQIACYPHHYEMVKLLRIIACGIKIPNFNYFENYFLLINSDYL